MTRLKTQTLRLLPPLCGVLAAFILISIVWITPALVSGTKEVVEFGSIVGPIFFDGNIPQQKSYQWNYDLHIVGSSDEVEIVPRLPFRITAMAGPNSGYGYIELDLKIYINDELAYRSVVRNTIEEGEPQGNTTRRSVGTPGEVEQVNQELIKSGSNRIGIITDVKIVSNISGSQDFQVTLGRPFIEIYKADADRDGVIDVHQLTSIHTGLVAIPAAALVGGIAWWGLARLLRRWTGESGGTSSATDAR